VTYAELGSELRTAREKAGRSISEVASETGLPERYVVALEKGNMGELPDLSYARLYLQSYARSLQLDPESMLESWPLTRAQVHVARTQPEEPPRTRSRGPLFVVLGLFLIVGGYLIFRTVQGPARDGQLQQTQRPMASPVQNVTAPGPNLSNPDTSILSAGAATAPDVVQGTLPGADPNTDPDPAAEAAASQATAQPATPVSGTIPVSPFIEPPPVVVTPRALEVVVAAQTWIVIEADGDTVVARVATRGEVITAEAKSDFRITVANPRDLKVVLDGRPLELSVRENRPLIRYPLPGKDSP
jgi:cytoskeletal protein RodZ